MSFLRLASRLCPETYRPDRPGLPIPSRSRVSVIAHRHPADPLWFRPPIRSYPSFMRRHLFPHGQSRSVRPWRFPPTPARGVRVRRTLVVLGSGGPMGTRGQIGPFPKSPRFPKIQFSQNRPKRPIRHTSPGFPSPELSPPPRYPARSPRETIPNPNECPIHPNCRSTTRQMPNQRYPTQMSPTDTASATNPQAPTPTRHPSRTMHREYRTHVPHRSPTYTRPVTQSSLKCNPSGKPIRQNRSGDRHPYRPPAAQDHISHPQSQFPIFSKIPRITPSQDKPRPSQSTYPHLSPHPFRSALAYRPIPQPKAPAPIPAPSP